MTQHKFSSKVKSIGVSDFSIKTLEVLLKEAKVVPVTNQFRISVCRLDRQTVRRRENHVTLASGRAPPWIPPVRFTLVLQSQK